METAILKTLIYADVFDFPLKAWEIHKWLISKRKSELSDVEKILQRLVKQKRVINKDGYYGLYGRSRVFKRRIDRIAPSQRFMKEARVLTQVLRLIPWVYLVGISGNLAVENASEDDDIDLFVITACNRLWISRFLILFVLALMEKRRTKRDSGKKAAGKYCLNLLLEEDQLEQKHKDLYIAHEVLQMKPLWERREVYRLFLEQNNWAFGFLANWLAPASSQSIHGKKLTKRFFLVDHIEALLRFVQLRYMGIPRKAETVSAHAVYFHPEDNRVRVLREYETRCRKYLKQKSA